MTQSRVAVNECQIIRSDGQIIRLLGQIILGTLPNSNTLTLMKLGILIENRKNMLRSENSPPSGGWKTHSVKYLGNGCKKIRD